MNTATIQAWTDLVLALPALVAAVGTVWAAIQAQKPAQKATRHLASAAAPSTEMLMEQTRPAQSGQ